jgi:hypothetical protein
MFKMHGIVLGRGSLAPESLRNTALKDYGIMAKIYADNVLEVKYLIKKNSKESGDSVSVGVYFESHQKIFRLGIPVWKKEGNHVFLNTT